MAFQPSYLGKGCPWKIYFHGERQDLYQELYMGTMCMRLSFCFNDGCVAQWVNGMTRSDKNPGSNPGHPINAMCCTLLSGEE